jgi:DNA polymerase-3 subunit gamma/tau
MVLSVGGGKELLLHSSEGDVDQLSEIAGKWGTQNLLAAAQIVDQALARMRMVTHSRVLLETALIRIAQLEDLQQLSDLIAQLHSGDVSSAPGKKKTEAVAAGSSTTIPDKQTTLRVDQAHEVSATPTVPPSTTTTPKSSPRHPMKQDAPPAELPKQAPSPAPASRQVGPPSGPVSTDGDIAKDAKKLWNQAATEFDGIAADCASHFVDAANLAPNRLVVTFPSSYNSSKSFCERPEKHSEMERIVSRIAGRKMKLEFAVRVDMGHETPAKPTLSVRQRDREITQRAFVQRAVELFSGNISGVNSPKRNDQ